MLETLSKWTVTPALAQREEFQCALRCSVLETCNSQEILLFLYG